MKKCIKCGIDKPLEMFHLDKSKKDGRVGACKECKKEYRKSYYDAHSEKAKEYAKQWFSSNKIRHINLCKEWKKNNRFAYLEYRRKRHAENYYGDNPYRLQHIMRAYLSKCRIGIDPKTHKRTVESLGYATDKLKARIEMNFKPGMNWNNYGEWEIDHKKPISIFMKQGITDPKLINALSNLQPMWKKDNRSKGNRWIG